MKINELGCKDCFHRNVCKYCADYLTAVSSLRDYFLDKGDILEIIVGCKNFTRSTFLK